MTRSMLIKLRRGTAAQWTAANPTLAAGEPGWESDTNKLKLGDGATAWNALAYFAPPGSSPLTTKGDLFGHSTLDARIPVGTDGQVLQADSTQALGVKWSTFTPAIGTFAAAQYSKAAVQSISTGTITTCALDTTDYSDDPNSYLSFNTGTHVLTVGHDGILLAVGIVNFATTGTTAQAELAMIYDGTAATEYARSYVIANIASHVAVPLIRHVVNGDTFVLRAYQTTGLNNNATPTLAVVLLHA